jgi:hypothetical protein
MGGVAVTPAQQLRDAADERLCASAPVETCPACEYPIGWPVHDGCEPTPVLFAAEDFEEVERG